MLSLLILLAQTSDPVPASVINSGGTAAALAFAFWLVRSGKDENRRLHEELRETNDKTLALAERAIPALVEATRTLREVRMAMDATQRNTGGGTQLDRITQQIEQVTEELRRTR